VEFLQDRQIKVATEIGGGAQEELEITLPAVLAIQSGITTLSYAALAKIMRARKMPIRSMSLKELGVNWHEVDAWRPKIVSVFDPPQAEYAEMISGNLNEIAEKIVGRMKNALG
jgi:electron transfer flavoprotein beta subunit